MAIPATAETVLKADTSTASKPEVGASLRPVFSDLESPASLIFSRLY